MRMHMHAGTPAARRARTSVLPLSRTPSRADARSERALAARARRAPCCAWNSGRRRCVPLCLDRMCHQGRCPCASYLSLAVRQSGERRRAGSPSASLGFCFCFWRGCFCFFWVAGLLLKGHEGECARRRRPVQRVRPLRHSPCASLQR